MGGEEGGTLAGEVEEEQAGWVGGRGKGWIEGGDERREFRVGG